jgi:hypothetical protein
MTSCLERLVLEVNFCERAAPPAPTLLVGCAADREEPNLYPNNKITPAQSRGNFIGGEGGIRTLAGAFAPLSI